MSAQPSDDEKSVGAAGVVSNPTADAFVASLEKYKSSGNDAFKKKDYNRGIDEYDKAVELYLNHDVHHTTITNKAKLVIGAVYNNRATCYFRLELYGAAITDSTQAVKCKFFKGFYRRGCAHAAMGKWVKAKKDFTKAHKHFPKNADISSKLKQSTEADRYQKFCKAIETEDNKPASETISAEQFGQPDSSYKGPSFNKTTDMTQEWVIELQTFLKDGGQLHIKYALDIVLSALEEFKKLRNVEYYSLPKDNSTDEKEESSSSSVANTITVCGDVHGQYYDFMNIFEMNGNPSVSNPYLFNGDFVDRGSWSMEIILVMLAWKLVLGPHFMMTRGNHESINMNTMYGFKGECEKKYNKPLFNLFTELFNYLPLAYILGNKVFVCHGGLFQQDNVTIDKLQSINRVCQPSEGNINEKDKAELMSDILWSDPQPMNGRSPSKRGGGIMFGPNITKQFLKLNNLQLLIRSHEVQKDGYSVAHDGQLVTIFSAPNYVDQMGNKGAYITLDRSYQPKYTQFEAVPHPDVKPMAYAGGPLSFLNFMN